MEMRFCVAVLVAVFSSAVAQAADSAGAYGFLSKVILEPNSNNPERIQVWGTFSVAAGTSGDYQAPERGYLYFGLPEDPSAALRDWNELKRISEAGSPIANSVGVTIKGIVAFGLPGMRARVRTSDETPDNPDSYSVGTRVAVVGYSDPSQAVRLLGRMPKPASRYNYALVDKVVSETKPGSPQRIQIWGTFAMGKPERASFADLQRGYLYLTLPPDANSAQGMINDWTSVAGTGHVMGFYIINYRDAGVRVRPSSEKPDSPDSYDPVRKDSNVIRADTDYAPVKALRDSR
jgi:tRNA U38,U39,U40 pseudouridine synthase TruA